MALDDNRLELDLLTMPKSMSEGGKRTTTCRTDRSRILALLQVLGSDRSPAEFEEGFSALNLWLDSVAEGWAVAIHAEPDSLVRSAAHFAVDKHARSGARRGGTDWPYVSHCAEVAALMSCVSSDPENIALCWLHDTIEDCGILAKDICAMFGHRVADGVQALTCPDKLPGISRRTRKALFRAQLAEADSDVQSCKVSDIISNARTVRIAFPGFARTYLLEKLEDLSALTKANAVLLAVATRIVESELLRLTRP